MENKAVIGALAALAQDSRLAVFRLLVQEGPGGLPAGRIAERLGISPPTLSFHLGELAAAGLVQWRRDGRSIIYAADYAAMNGLIAYLTENCCRGDLAACGAVACEPASPARQEKRGDSSDEAPARVARR
jgi:ArsR family transcriptional regulator, arsenate/arsenite/antimonite-responsive transcriptional repressor